MRSEALFIARDSRSKAHCLIRVVRPDDLDVPVPIPSANALSDLMMARDVAGLADAAQALGPLRTSSSDLGKLALKPSQVTGGTAPVALEDPDPTYLWQEAFFDPYSRASDDGFEAFGRGAKVAAKRAAENRRFSARRSYSDDYAFLVEPLADWAFLRSLLSICMRLGGLYRGGAYDASQAGGDPESAASGLLEKAGFQRIEQRRTFLPTELDAPAYVIPIGFNPFFFPGNAIKNDLLFDASVINPLFDDMTVSHPRAMGLTYVTSLKGERGIKFVTAMQAGRATGGSTLATTAGKEARSVADKWLYLAIEEGEGDTQLDLANRLLRGVDALLGRPRVGYAAKWTREISPTYRDLPEALWARVREHPDHYLMTCENCHRTILATNQGAYRRFCGSSCRSIWNREHKDRG